MTTRRQAEEVRGLDVALGGSSSSKGSSSVRVRATQTAVLNIVNDYTESIHSSEGLSKERNVAYKRALWVPPKPHDSSPGVFLIPVLAMEKATGMSYPYFLKKEMCM